MQQLTKSQIVELPLSEGYVTFIDAADYELVKDHDWKLWKRHKGKKLYAGAYTTINGKRVAIAMHTLIMNAKKGDIIDHADSDGLNNTRINLRFCNQTGNSANRIKATNNTSGFKGVVWHKTWKRWDARVKVNHKQIFLGSFNNPIDAARAYDKAAIQYFGEFAKTNESLGLFNNQCKKE